MVRVQSLVGRLGYDVIQQLKPGRCLYTFDVCQHRTSAAEPFHCVHSNHDYLARAYTLLTYANESHRCQVKVTAGVRITGSHAQSRPGCKCVRSANRPANIGELQRGPQPIPFPDFPSPISRSHPPLPLPILPLPSPSPNPARESGECYPHRVHAKPSCQTHFGATKVKTGHMMQG